MPRAKEVKASRTVAVPADVAFAVWDDQRRYPEWMDHLVEVRPCGPRHHEWTMERLDGGVARWQTETTVRKPDQSIAWSSIDGDLVTYGRVDVKPAGKGKATVKVRRFHAVGRDQDPDLIRQRFGDPQHKLEQDLDAFEAHVRRLASTGAQRANAMRAAMN